METKSVSCVSAIVSVDTHSTLTMAVGLKFNRHLTKARTLGARGLEAQTPPYPPPITSTSTSGAILSKATHRKSQCPLGVASRRIRHPRVERMKYERQKQFLLRFEYHSPRRVCVDTNNMPSVTRREARNEAPFSEDSRALSGSRCMNRSHDDLRAPTLDVCAPAPTIRALRSIRFPTLFSPGSSTTHAAATKLCYK